MGGMLGSGMGGVGNCGLVGSIIGLLFFFGLMVVGIALLVWLWRRSSGTSSPDASEKPSARQLLEVRYARGEIAREEFLSVREDLR